MFSAFSSVFNPSNAFRNFTYSPSNKTHKKRPESVSEKRSPLIMATNPLMPQLNRTKQKKVVATIVETEPTSVEVSAILRRHRKTSRVHNKVAKQLEKLCPQSGFCLALGAQQINRINDFFTKYATFKYLSKINRLGVSSNNGAVFEYVYKRASYDAFCIFKMSMGNRKDLLGKQIEYMSDNLMYEYWVGQFVNKHVDQFPCFVETYGLYKFSGRSDNDREKKYTLVLNNGVYRGNLLGDFMTRLKRHHLFTMISDQPLSWDDACLYSKYLALLTQHIPITHSIPANTLISTNSKTLDYANHVLSNDFLYILYQLYMPLSVLAEVFTHYDLHTGNVLLYKPHANKYVEYNYHYADGTIVSFLSPFIVKIIDYGRCYVKNGEGNTSMEVYQKLCSIKDSPNCNTNARYLCGDNKGFEFMDMRELRIKSTTKNISQDLKFANYFRTRYNALYAGEENGGVHLKKCCEIINKIVYGKGVDSQDSQYGTVEDTDRDFTSQIKNVSAMHDALKETLLDEEIIAANNEQYEKEGWSKLGTLTVYCNDPTRPMTYVPV